MSVKLWLLIVALAVPALADLLVVAPPAAPLAAAAWPAGWRPEPAPPPVGWAVDFRQYPTSEQISEFCYQLAGAYPDLVKVLTLGFSVQGRPVVALRLGNSATGDPDQRPALQIDGQHHAREPIGQQAVLYTVWHLASTYGTDPLTTHLLDTRTVYVLPCVNPDGNEVFLDRYWGQRKNLRPVDDDGDGLVDEDPPSGVAGWDVFQRYEVRLNPIWLAMNARDPLAAGWSVWARFAGGGFYDQTSGRSVPQLDQDGDGQAGEDLLGGVDLNRNYPAGWELCSDDPASAVYRGPQPWSEPETRAVRALIESRGNILLAVSYHSGDDRLAVPGVPGGAQGLDEQLIERMGIKASQLTAGEGFAGTRHQQGSLPAPGEARTWLYELGILPWLVEAYLLDGPVGWEWLDRPAGRALASYHTGLRFNPAPGDGILAVCRRWLDLNLYLLAAVPCPRPGVVRLDEAAGTLVVELHNDGLVPVDVELTATVAGTAVASGEYRNLSGGGVEARLTLSRAGLAAAAAGSPIALVISSSGPSQEHPGRGLVSVYECELPAAAGASGRVEAISGTPAGRLVDLGSAFGPGGWDADPALWDDDYFHFGRLARPPAPVL